MKRMITVFCTLVLGMFSAMTYAADPIYTGFFSVELSKNLIVAFSKKKNTHI